MIATMHKRPENELNSGEVREIKLKIQTMDGPELFGERLAKDIFRNAIVRGGSEKRPETVDELDLVYNFVKRKR